MLFERNANRKEIIVEILSKFNFPIALFNDDNSISWQNREFKEKYNNNRNLNRP